MQILELAIILISWNNRCKIIILVPAIVMLNCVLS